jgi:hypothetical protein
VASPWRWRRACVGGSDPSSKKTRSWIAVFADPGGAPFVAFAVAIAAAAHVGLATLAHLVWRGGQLQVPPGATPRERLEARWRFPRVGRFAPLLVWSRLFVGGNVRLLFEAVESPPERLPALAAFVAVAGLLAWGERAARRRAPRLALALELGASARLLLGLTGWSDAVRWVVVDSTALRVVGGDFLARLASALGIALLFQAIALSSSYAWLAIRRDPLVPGSDRATIAGGQVLPDADPKPPSP